MTDLHAAHSEESSWWDRPAGGREVMRVALPLVVSSLSWTVMTFIDRMLLKWDSGASMAAAFSASVLWFAILCLPLGVCMYCATFVSQYHGNDQPRRIGPAVWQGVWITVAVSPVLVGLGYVAPSLLAATQHDAEVARLATLYFQILCIGIPPMLIAQALCSFYAGRGETVVMMRVDAGVAIVNLVLDYLWIFGHAGFPRMGIAGAGWATVVALWSKAILYFLLLLRRSHRQQFATLSMRLDRDLFGRLVYFGTPSGFQLLLDVVGFTVFILLVGRLGAVEAEATSMVFSISTLAFMPIWGFAQAASILVGQSLGQDRGDLAARATWTTLGISLGYMSVVSLLYVLLPDLFLFGFFTAAEATSHETTVRQLALTLLRFVAAYNLLDATAIVFVSAIKGAGDTRFVLRVSLVMATALAYLSWLTIEVVRFGIYGCWTLISGWVWGLGLIYMARFLQGKWRTMRVIEQTPVHPPLVASDSGAG